MNNVDDILEWNFFGGARSSFLIPVLIGRTIFTMIFFSGKDPADYCTRPFQSFDWSSHNTKIYCRRDSRGNVSKSVPGLGL
jgi:hypothetical protein